MGVNDDLVAPLESESFYANAAFGTVSIPRTGSPTHTAGPLALDFQYDADTGTYQLSDGTLTQSFSSANIDPLKSDAAQTTYVKGRGNTTDTLTLLKNGIADGQMRYVGAGFFHRLTERGQSRDDRFDAFTYGALTPDASMPIVGSASFDVNLIGAYNWVQILYGLGGTGTLNIDFSSGAIGGSGLYTLTNLETQQEWTTSVWATEGMLTAGSNDFTGTLRLHNIGDAALNGSFYGPAADEVGAVWYLNSEDTSTVGALYGARGDYPLNELTNLSYPEHDAFFTPLTNSIRADLDKDTEVLSNPATHDELKAVYLSDDGYTRVYYRNPSEILQPSFEGELTYEHLVPGRLSFARVGQMLDQRGDSAILDSFVYGFATDPADMPITGHAYYELWLRGGLLASGEQLQTIIGGGALLVDFASGDLTLDGNYSIYNWPPASGLVDGALGVPVSDSGAWSGTADVASNGFAGTLLLDGATDYNGTLDGQFFGPDSSELGAVFHLTGGGSQVSGTVAGIRDDAVGPAYDTLAGLTSQRLMSSMDNWLIFRRWETSGVGGHPSNEGGGTKTYQVYFDPTSDTARITVVSENDQADTEYALARVGDADRSDVLSSDAANVYTFSTSDSGETTDYRVVEEIFDGSGGRVALTYAGFASIFATRHDSGEVLYGPVETAYFMPFGIATPYKLQPTTGSATYSGTAIGRGGIYDFVNSQVAYYDLSGTNTMSVDFAAGEFTSTLSLAGAAINDATSTLNFGTYGFAGALGAVNFTGLYQQDFGFFGDATGPDYEGRMEGTFFGPEAQEFGGVFDLSIDSVGGSQGFARGGFVGKAGTPPP